jgi:tetratricopeptide (TPR) repeat protein
MKHRLPLLSHPWFNSFLASAFGLVCGIYSAVLFSFFKPFTESSGVLEPEMGPMVGKPWSALLLGLAIGTAIMLFQKRQLRKSAGFIVDFYMMSVPERARPSVMWRNMKVNLPAMLGFFMAFGLAWILRVSVLVCVEGILIPAVLAYPERRQIYDAARSRLMEAETQKKSAPGRKKLVVATAVFCLLIAVILGFLLYETMQLGTSMREFGTMMLGFRGSQLTSEEAEKLEDTLKVNPDDLSSRTQLLGYYFCKQFESDAARTAHQKHVLWVIEHCPDAMVAGQPEACLNPRLDGDAYHKAKELWLKQVESHKNDTAVLGNAAQFVFIHEKDMAEDLLKTAQAFEPANPEWAEELAFLYSLGMGHEPADERAELAAKALEQLEMALSLTRDKADKFDLLDELAVTAFESGDLEKAESYATEALSKASRYKKDWDRMYWEAVHNANTVLGRIALRSDDLAKAKRHLIESGRIEDPDYDDPSMALAKELLEAGEREVVLEYFQLCGAFWEDDEEHLAKWTSIVEKDGIPEFDTYFLY